MGRRLGLACMAASAPDGPPLVMSAHDTRFIEPFQEKLLLLAWQRIFARSTFLYH